MYVLRAVIRKYAKWYKLKISLFYYIYVCVCFVLILLYNNKRKILPHWVYISDNISNSDFIRRWERNCSPFCHFSAYGTVSLRLLHAASTTILIHVLNLPVALDTPRYNSSLNKEKLKDIYKFIQCKEN